MVILALDRGLSTTIERSSAAAAAAMSAAAEVLQSHLEFVLDERVGALTPDQKRFLDVASRHGQRLVKLADDLGLVVHGSRGELELDWARCDLVQLVNDARDHVWPIAHVASKPIELHAEDPVFVIADERRLGRALHELVDLAVGAASSGSTVELVVRNDSVEITYESEALPDEGSLSLAVADSLVTALGGALTVERTGERVVLRASLPPEERLPEHVLRVA
jgi:signal transduction histidine kinase